MKPFLSEIGNIMYISDTGEDVLVAMKDMYDAVVQRVMDCYSDPQPRLRAVACYTMPVLVNRRLDCTRQ